MDNSGRPTREPGMRAYRHGYKMEKEIGERKIATGSTHWELSKVREVSGLRYDFHQEKHALEYRHEERLKELETRHESERKHLLSQQVQQSKELETRYSRRLATLNEKYRVLIKPAREPTPAERDLWRRKVENAIARGPSHFSAVSTEAIASGALSQSNIDAIYKERGKHMPKKDVDKKVMVNAPGNVCTQGGHDPYR